MDKDSSRLNDQITMDMIDTAELLLEQYSDPEPLDKIIEPFRCYSAYDSALFQEFRRVLKKCDPQQIKGWNFFVGRMANCIIKSAFNPCYFSEKDRFEQQKDNDPDGRIQKININDAINEAKTIEEIEPLLEMAKQYGIQIRDDFKDAFYFIKTLKELKERLGRSSKKLLNPIVELMNCLSVFVTDRFFIEYEYLRSEPARKASHKRTARMIEKFKDFIPYFDLVRNKMATRKCGLKPASFSLYDDCKNDKEFQRLIKKYYGVNIKRNDERVQKGAKQSFYYLLRSVHNYRVATAGVGLNGKKTVGRPSRSEESRNRSRASKIASDNKKRKRTRRKKEQ